jgi:mobilization protein NikA
MKKEAAPKRTKWLTIRMTEQEYTQLEKLGAKTISPNLSDYGRRVLLQKPVTVRYRNQSLDDFLADMLILRRELNAIGSNFNQAVHRLHSLHIVPEIQHWILINEQDKTQLFRQIETISNKINDAYTLWSRV